MKDDLPKVMTAEEVARLFAVSKRTITRWVDTIPGFPVPVSPEGSPLRFIRQEVLEFFYRGHQR
ncbi:helix-turn-helix domain-containing protein [Escherichia coli]|uniref:helix-turn-helix domain-containing protein n=1 Tax=Escherichia coli TaxID=562 RepID=UPI001F13D4DD|nr:helix-turn-helix domain-containing protein [Escherichia coli]MCH6370385.1 helix-turn-helix domain-containing protein [Escherichia coli]MCH6444641.1 helix-turn-helix domain-containing protein [Escherichia coli]